MTLALMPFEVATIRDIPSCLAMPNISSESSSTERPSRDPQKDMIMYSNEIRVRTSHFFILFEKWIENQVGIASCFAFSLARVLNFEIQL